MSVIIRHSPQRGAPWIIIGKNPGECRIIYAKVETEEEKSEIETALKDAKYIGIVVWKSSSEEVQRHLEELHSMHKDEFFFVVLDNASLHTTPMLHPFLEANRNRLLLVFLPTYSPHLNWAAFEFLAQAYR